MDEEIIISTSENVNGKLPKKTFGIVRGNTVRARWFGRDIAASFKNLVGGEIKSYTDLTTAARDEAVARMVDEAKKKGANAVIMVRFSMGEIMPGAVEILAYGTAVLV